MSRLTTDELIDRARTVAKLEREQLAESGVRTEPVAVLLDELADRLREETKRLAAVAECYDQLREIVERQKA